MTKLTLSRLTLALVVSVKILHSLNGDSPSFLRDLGICLRTMRVDPMEEVDFVSVA